MRYKIPKGTVLFPIVLRDRYNENVTNLFSAFLGTMTAQFDWIAPEIEIKIYVHKDSRYIRFYLKNTYFLDTKIELGNGEREIMGDVRVEICAFDAYYEDVQLLDCL